MKIPAKLFLLLLASMAAGDEGDQDDPNARVVYHFAEIKPGGNAEAALRVYNEWGGGPGAAMPPEVMQRMYEAAGGGDAAFKTIAQLIDKGLERGSVDDGTLKTLKIDEAHSKQMAAIRERYIEGVIDDILTSKKGEWKLGRSDSGNPDSGMRSDLDQTFYVLKKGPHGQWVRDLDADKAFIELFKQRWKAKHPKLSLAALDIASIEGKQRFPDPRDVHLDFEGKFLETIDTLRRTPGAYTFSGAVAQQMQFRALAAVLSDEPRAFMEYEIGKDGKMKKLPFNRDYAQRILFGISPDLIPGHAFGAAVANFLELQKYMKKTKFESKYHLRVWEDCGHILAMPDKLKEGKVEYTDLDADERAKRNAAIVDPMFSDPKQAELHKLALDISAKLRLIHKGELERVFGADVPEPAARDAALFDELARQVFPDIEGKPSDAQIKAAVAEHRRLASEFCLESVYRSSVEAFRVYRDPHFKQPLNLDGYRHLMRGVPEADWPKVSKNLQFASRMTLLYTLYDLGWYKSGVLLKRMSQHFDDVGLVELGKLWAEGRVQGLAAPLRNQKLRQAMYADLHRRLSLEIDLEDFTRRGMKQSLGKLNERVQRRILTELGFKNVEGAHMVGKFLSGKKLSWSPARFARNALYDPGSIDALAQIVRAYVTTEGDMEHVKAVALNELIFAIPVAGQLYSLSKGGVTGLVLMAGAIQFPPFGVVLIVYSVGEAGYAIYDVEYAKHAKNNIVDAIYRGFSGPATRAYDSPPPQFKDKDAHLLKVLSTRLRRAQAAKNEAEIKDLAPRVAQLQAKKESWKTFRDGSWAGGYFTEWGAQKEQKPILVSLLGDVPPIISFSPMGVIDFRAKFSPRRDNARIKELTDILENTKDVEAYLKAAHELDELELQKDRYERARRYLKAAVGKDRAGLSEREKRQGIPELLHKIRRDSLYPALYERAVRLKDERGNLSTPNPDSFVDDWIKAVGDWAVRELNDKGVMSGGDAGDLPVQDLKDRLYADYARSKTIYQEFQKREKIRKATAELRLQKRMEAYKAEAAGLAVEGFDLSAMTTALLMASVRRNAPRVDADVVVVRKKGRDDKLAPESEVHVRVRVKADPHLYRGPYKSKLHRLNRAAAQAAISAGAIDDIPLTEESKATLQRLLQAAGDSEVMIPVVSVFASAMADLSKAIPATIAHLPRKTADGIFMGQVVPVGKPEEVEKEPEPEPDVGPAGPAQIMMEIPQPATRNERLAGMIEYEWQEPSRENSTFVVYKRDNNKKPASPHLWVEWPDMPEKKRIVLDWHVKGGIPLVDIKPKRSGVSVYGKDEFGWGIKGRGLRTRVGNGNRFTLEVPLGFYFRSAGEITVSGRLMAFGYKQKWKTEKPEAEYRFRTSITYYPPPIVATGKVNVDGVGHASGSIQIENGQADGRLARIEVGGTTYFNMVDRSTSFRAYNVSGAPASATITFRNFGEDVTLTVPLKAGTVKERAKPRTERLQKTLKEIAKFKSLENGYLLYLTKIIANYDRCASMYKPTAYGVVEIKPWLKYYQQTLADHEALVQGMANAGWKGWQNTELRYKSSWIQNLIKKGTAAEGMEFNRLKYGQWLANRYASGIDTAKYMGLVELATELTKRAEAHAGRMKPHKDYTPECWRTAARGHYAMAELIFHATGDFSKPNELVVHGNLLMDKADAMAGQKKREYNPFRFKPDPKFDPGR